MAEKDSQQSGKDVSLAAGHPLQSTPFLLVVALATTGWAVGGVVSLAVGRGSIAATITYPIGWVMGGIVTALVLYWANPAMKWQQTLAIIIGWAVSWPISMAFCGAGGGFAGATVAVVSGQRDMMPIAFVVSLIIGLVIAGTTGGFVTGMIMQWANPSIRRTQLILIVVGWFIAWVIGGAVSWTVNRNVVSLVGWTIGGAIGNSVMFRQIGRTGIVQNQL